MRGTGADSALGNVSCGADVFAGFNNTPYSAAHLTYTVTRLHKGQVVASVAGIPGLGCV